MFRKMYIKSDLVIFHDWGGWRLSVEVVLSLFLSRKEKLTSTHTLALTCTATSNVHEYLLVVLKIGGCLPWMLSQCSLMSSVVYYSASNSTFLTFIIISLLLPSGGYKGYGLGMMVEVFCGILAGAQYSKYVRTWKVTDRVANLVCSVVLHCIVI